METTNSKLSLSGNSPTHPAQALRQSRLLVRLGGLGIVYSVLFVAATVLFGNDPGTGASGPTVVRFYTAHRTSEFAGVFVVAVAAIAFTFFLSALRRRLEVTDDDRFLSAVVTAGGAIYVVGLLLMSALTVALIDAAHDRIVVAAQTLNVLASDAWVPVVVGLSITALGTGISALRSATLPKWLAWTTLALGVLAVSGPLGGVAFVITPVWTLVMGVVLLRSAASGHGTAAATFQPAQS
jgi:hypothetical protein